MKIADVFLFSRRSKADEQSDIVGLDFRFVCRAVAAYRAALAALVDDDISLFRVGLDGDGIHYPAAVARPVAGVYVDVQRTKAPRAMVARRISERQHLKTAVLTYKAAVVFLKKLLLHYFFDFSSGLSK